MRDSSSGAVTLTVHGYRRIETDTANGLSKKSLAARLGVGYETLARLLKNDERAALAFDQGIAALEDEVAGHLLARAREGNVVAAIFLGKSRLGWREADKVPADQKPPVNIVIPPPMSAEELERFIKNREQPVIENDSKDRSD